jgi:hypothetical protein
MVAPREQRLEGGAGFRDEVLLQPVISACKPRAWPRLDKSYW